MKLFCPDCGDEVTAEIDDCSFDHEFGVQYIYDCYCPDCQSLLHTYRHKLPKEIEEP